MKKTLIFVILLVITTSIYSQSKEEDIKKLLEITGSADLGMQVMYSMIDQFQEILPEVPEEYWRMVLKEFSGDDLIDLVVPIYDRHFTHTEIEDVIRFYETPTGKKMTEKLPFITQESMMAGQKWGMEIGEKIQKRLIEDGYLEI